jgi:hypothetical protein
MLVCALAYVPLRGQEMPQPTPAPLPAPQPRGAPQGSTVVLREGTEVKLKFAEAISSKTATVDDPVTLILDEEVKVGDLVVAKPGSKAFATVTNAKKAGMMGKGGELNIRLESLRSGDAKIHLRGTKARQGDDKVGATVALTILFGPIGLIKHGKNIEIKEGTPLTAYVADDITLPPVQ